jgi:hypothetical protein
MRSSSLRTSELAGGSRRLAARLAIFVLSVVAASASSHAAQDSDAVLLDRLNQERQSLVGEGNLADELFFGWFDRPYRRATLAAAWLTIDAARAAQTAGRAASDAPMAPLSIEDQGWLLDALTRSREPALHPGFLPHRLPVIDEAPPGRRLAFPVVGVLRGTAAPGSSLDDSTAPSAGAIAAQDLIACLGFRACGGSATVPARARSLGVLPVAFVRAVELDPAVEASISTSTLYDWLAGSPASGETLLPSLRLAQPHSVATPLTNARLMSLGDGAEVPLCGTLWETTGEPPADHLPPHLLLWMQVLMGAQSTILLFPNDEATLAAADASSAAVPSPTTRLLPLLRSCGSGASLEAFAHASLDLQRLAAYLPAFERRPQLAILVGEDALAGDGTAWAAWLEPAWRALSDRQIRYDIYPYNTDADALAERYTLVVPLRKSAAARLDTWLFRLRLSLALIPEYVRRPTAREQDGTIAADVHIQAGETPSGRPCIALINLRDEPRVLMLRGGDKAGSLRDLINGEVLATPAELLPMAPRQVRLLWPTEE